MMIYDVVAIIRSQNNWDHMLTEKILKPFLPFFSRHPFRFAFDFTRIPTVICVGAQISNIDWLENWFSDGNHWMLLHKSARLA